MTTAQKTRIDPVKVGKFVDLRSDFGFKMAFGNSQNKDILIGFLNQLFEGKKKIVSLTYLNTEQLNDTRASRQAIIGVRCKGSNGEQFIIAMQWANQDHFIKRGWFYTSWLIKNLAERGKDGDFNFPDIYYIGILDFNYQEAHPDKYLHRIQLMNNDPDGTVVLECPKWILLELPRFDLKPEDLKTDLEKWCFLLKNMGQLEEIPANLNTESFKKLFSIATLSNYSKRRYQMYKKSLFDKQTEYAVRQFAINEGEAKGEAKGRAEGRAEGQVEATTKVIRSLLRARELSVAKIAEHTG